MDSLIAEDVFTFVSLQMAHILEASQIILQEHVFNNAQEIQITILITQLEDVSFIVHAFH